jgi:acetyl esterase/lipase
MSAVLLRHRRPRPLTCLVNVVYTCVDDTELALDVLAPSPMPDTPLATVVRIDGCPGWGPGTRSTAMVPFANPLLAKAGFLTVAPTIRHSGRANFPAQVDDVRAALSWLRRNPLGLPIAADRIGIWGQSAGGHLAALAGLMGSAQRVDGHPEQHQETPTVQAVVTISGPSDLLQTGGQMYNDRPSPITALVGGDITTHRVQLRDASPVSHVTPNAPPFLVVHGRLDETVPCEQSERLHSELQANGVESDLLVIEGVYHNMQHDPEARYEGQVWYDVGAAVIEFFDRHLRPT